MAISSRLQQTVVERLECVRHCSGSSGSKKSKTLSFSLRKEDGKVSQGSKSWLCPVIIEWCRDDM